MKSYLSGLKRKYGKQNQNREELFQGLITQINEQLSQIPFKSTYTTLRTGNLLFDGAYLISREDVSLFKKKVKEIDINSPDFQLFLSGPWPPYSFCNLDLSDYTG
ncbi:MAG: GvpL/GvpF family gas vesicle protein [Halanaerobiales bacterium]|nr:GvpL/GvpF family gas vesicle protein [Halanaerobiales bacterium]